MSGKHTPGPWIWADKTNGLYGAGPNNAVLDFFPYEGMHLSGSTEECQEANARLIAAAPDLLAGLAAIVDRADNGDLGTSKVQDMRRIAADLLKKVEGV